jgi:hypothetical protein
MAKRILPSCLVGLVLSMPVFTDASATSATAMPAVSPAASAQDGSHDFDFLYGKWHVHNRRLQGRLSGSHQWVEFDATDEFQPLPGGIGSEEHYRTDYWKDYVGIGLHFYQSQTQQWSLYWVDNHALPGVLQPPVSGKFTGNVGTFEGPDTFNGKPITVRFMWKVLSKNHAQWEQAFSADGGQSWETNWTMDFTR